MREKKAINIEIGANIQAAREQSHYTQEELSELIDVTPNHLSSIERGASGASLETIKKLCTTLGVSANYLMFGDDKSDDFAAEIAAQMSRIKPQYRPQIRKLLTALMDVLTMQEEQQ